MIFQYCDDCPAFNLDHEQSDPDGKRYTACELCMESELEILDLLYQLDRHLDKMLSKKYNRKQGEMIMKICDQYTGVNCVNGSCPIANAEEYAERGMDVIRNCEGCSFYKGCEDCAFFETEICDKDDKSVIDANLP